MEHFPCRPWLCALKAVPDVALTPCRRHGLIAPWAIAISLPLTGFCRSLARELCIEARASANLPQAGSGHRLIASGDRHNPFLGLVCASNPVNGDALTGLWAVGPFLDS
jgi:hypothetical protein